GSGKAFRKGRSLKARGASYEEMRQALLDDEDSDIAAWARTKGMAANERELRRIWDHAPYPGNASLPSKHFAVLAFEEITIDTAPAYLVRGLMPRTGLVIIWGPPKCGKSFWVFDLFMHVALGWDYRGHRVQQGPVVYCAPEGAHGFKARVEAFRQ